MVCKRCGNFDNDGDSICINYFTPINYSKVKNEISSNFDKVDLDEKDNGRNELIVFDILSFFF